MRKKYRGRERMGGGRVVLVLLCGGLYVVEEGHWGMRG